MDRGGISNQLAQNPPFSGQVNYSFANGYRVTFTGQAPPGTQTPTAICLTSCNAAGATNPLPSKGPIQVDLNNPHECRHLGCDAAHQQDSQRAGVELPVRAPDRPTTCVMSLAYVGTKGTHLTTYYNYNRQYYNSPSVHRELSHRLQLPALGAINTQATIGNSTYNALQTQSEPPLHQRFAVRRVNYTWSHAIDDSPGAFDNYSANGATSGGLPRLGALSGRARTSTFATVSC